MDCPAGYRCVAEPQWSPETWLPLLGVMAVTIVIVVLLIAWVNIKGRHDGD